MEPEELWRQFARTGAPEDYLRYRRASAQREERERVPVTA